MGRKARLRFEFTAEERITHAVTPCQIFKADIFGAEPEQLVAGFIYHIRIRSASGRAERRQVGQQAYGFRDKRRHKRCLPAIEQFRDCTQAAPDPGGIGALQNGMLQRKNAPAIRAA